MPSSIKLTEPLDILVEYGYLDDETPYHKAISIAVNDFSSDKTLGGEYNRDYIEILQKEASKELKTRRKKINVKSFKEKFLNKKEEPVTTGTSSIVPYKPPAPSPDLSLPEGEDQQQETEGLKGIRDILDEILKVLRLDFKGDRKEARDMQKDEAKKKRDEREGKIEGVGKSTGLIGKSVQAMVKPFSNIWDAIINFLNFTLIGVLFNKTLSWFQDPKNEEKTKRIGKFFSDWWPALATAAALFLTPLGGLIKGVVGLLTAIIPKLVIAIAANPYAALALVGTGLAVWGITSLAKGLGGDKEGGNLSEAQNQSSTQLQEEGMGGADAEVLSQSVTTSNTERMTQGDTNIRSNTNILQTGRNDPLGGNSMGRFNFNEGGFVSGPGGVDKVPAKLTAGEFVMSKGAVQKYGANTFAAMNAAGGGTGGIARNMMKEPVGTPVINSTNKTITLPTIKKEGQDIIPSTVDDPLPTFRIPIVSSQRSMVLSSLGIQDLVGE